MLLSSKQHLGHVLTILVRRRPEAAMIARKGLVIDGSELLLLHDPLKSSK